MFECLGDGIIQESRENPARGREDTVTSLGSGSGKGWEWLGVSEK